MIFVRYKFDNKVKKKFKSLDIDINELKRFSTFIINEYKNTRKIWKYDIDISGINCVSSGYYGGYNEIELALKSHKRSKVKRKEFILSSFFHELCHFCQDNLDGYSFEKRMDYNEEDVERVSDKYYYNPLEIKARKFEEKYTKIYLQMFNQ